ncbi:MAG: GNAT family N-acetyltransferase [Pseudomonadota bacterium]
MPTLVSLESIKNPDALREIVTEYLVDEIALFNAASGQALDPADFVDATMDNLGAYLPPRGRILAAERADGSYAGVVFLKGLGGGVFEVKRLSVRPANRGQGLARALMARLLEEVRTMGGTTVLLDLGKRAGPAAALYRSLGFEEIPPYPETENTPEMFPYLTFMRLDVTDR